MTTDEVIQRLRDSKGQVMQIAREAGLPYGTLRKLVTGETPDPRGSTIDALRTYFQSRPQ